MTAASITYDDILAELDTLQNLNGIACDLSCCLPTYDDADADEKSNRLFAVLVAIRDRLAMIERRIDERDRAKVPS